MKRLIFKAGVVPFGMHPKLKEALLSAIDVYWEVAQRPCVVTSAWDSEHASNSLHYAGMAVDLRTKNLTAQEKREVASRLVDQLGDAFDVVVEANHIHLEFDAGKAFRDLWIRKVLQV